MIARPVSLTGLHGIDKQIEVCKSFLHDFQNDTPGHKKAILLHGHQGTGKSSLVECLSHDYNFPVFEINGSETRTRDQFISTVTKYTTITPKSVKHCIIHVDEADGLSNVEDKNKESTIDVLYNIIKKTRHPIFLTANDDYPLRKLSDIVIKVPFYRHKPQTVSKILRNYTDDEQKIYDITQYCDGDIRAALSMLESIAQKRFTNDSIFHVVDNLLQHKHTDGEIDILNNYLIEWMEENAQHRLLGVSFLLAYQNICNSSRLLRESSKYSKLLLTENIRLVSHFRRNEYTKVLPPSFRARLKESNTHRKTILSLAKKLPFHSVRSFESEILPLLQNLSRNKEWLKQLYYQHNLNQAEVSILMNVPYDDIAVVSFISDTESRPESRPEMKSTPVQTKLSINVFEV